MFDAVNSALDAGLDPSLAAFMPRFMQIESGGNPNARTGSYSGLLQMGPDETAKYGGNGLPQGAKMYADRANWFAGKYGRAPSPTELYLTNQQGQGGIAAHLGNPDAPAWENMYSTAEGQKKGASWAKKAIWGNVPDDVKGMFPGGVDSLTSKQFVDLWQHKVERTPMANAFADNRNTQMNPIQSAMTQTDENQYGYVPGYDPKAGLFDRLRAGGPGALFGAPHGVFPGTNGQPGYDLGNRLQRAGAWAMAVSNPGALGAISGLQNNRKFVQIGTDDMGNPRYGFVDERNGTVMPANGGAMGGATGSTSGNGITEAINEGKSGSDLLKDSRIPGPVSATANSIIQGTQAYNPGVLMRTPFGRSVLTVLSSAAPGEDLTGRQAAAKDWATKSAELTRRAGQAARHGGELVDSFNDIKGSTSYPAANAAINFIDQQTGGPAVGKAQQNITAFANEMGALVRGNGGSDASFREWAAGFPVNGSEEQKRGAIAMGAKLFQDSMQELEQKRTSTLGPTVSAAKGPLFSPEVKAAVQKMVDYGNGGKAAKLPAGVKSIQLIPQ